MPTSSRPSAPTSAEPSRQLDLATAASLSPEQVLLALGSDDDGLTDAQVVQRRAIHGPNVLTSHHVTVIDVLVRQLRNPLLILLLAAAGVSAWTGGTTEGGIIAAIVVLSVGLGFVNEYRSEQAVAALHARIRHRSRVWREGVETLVDVRDLVPGDVVEVQLGDLVPADLRLLSVNRLECDEAALTGESMPAAKDALAVTGDGEAGSPAEFRCCLFMGTVVHQGTGRGVVVCTGSGTAFGRIAVGLGEEHGETGFQAGLRSFSQLLVRVGATLTVSIFVFNVVARRPIIDALLFSLAIAIGITPQLLPAIVSVSLATGSHRLAAKGVLVKRLVSIEDLGNIDLLFTDKTGTLTEGAITFDRAVDPAGAPAEEVLRQALAACEVTLTAAGPVGANTLDLALWSAPAAAGLIADHTAVPDRVHVVSISFDHDRQMGSVVVTGGDGSARLITKGAPEAVLARCVDLPDTAAATLAQLFDSDARVIAVAGRDATGIVAPSPSDEVGLRLTGFLTFVDRPKVGAAASIQRLGAAGIEVKVITGDNGTVAARVCSELDLQVTGILNGAEVEAMSDDELAATIPTTTIFARITPNQKSRIVTVARRTGVDVAYLGDGVNDAVALHAADVGISVDTATEIAKDAADIVLLDKDLGVLADGVVEGRRIFANTLKYVLMATSSNFGNMFSAAGASLFLGFLPMLPSQILLNNLLYDVGQLAIPTDRVDDEVLARPAAWDIAFVRRFMSVFGPISSIFDFITFAVMLWLLHANHDEFRSGWFVESLATQTLVIFVIRTRRVPFVRSRPSAAMIVTPIACAVIGAVLPFTPLAGSLGFTALPISFFLVLVGMIVSYLVLVELAKARFYAAQGHPRKSSLSDRQRHERHIARRVGHYSHHGPPTTVSSAVRPAARSAKPSRRRGTVRR